MGAGGPVRKVVLEGVRIAGWRGMTRWDELGRRKGGGRW